MPLYPAKSYPTTQGLSEFDILKASHKFLRDDETASDNPSTSANAPSWGDQLAEKYYANLYREFALCDLKHYKTGNFALRWRTESEVLSGAGESTCANTRCKHHHHHHQNQIQKKSQLTTLELPFAYTEHGQPKQALVKVVLCSKCVKKLMWKRHREKEVEEKDHVQRNAASPESQLGQDLVERTDAGVHWHDTKEPGVARGCEDDNKQSAGAATQVSRRKGRDEGEKERNASRGRKESELQKSQDTPHTEELTRRKRHREGNSNLRSEGPHPRRRRSRSRSPQSTRNYTYLEGYNHS